MRGTWYTDEFKIEAVRQVTEHGRSVVEVSRLHSRRQKWWWVSAR